jgi:hypothetical protein
MGRLTLHILLSFAQFERDLISERTRDKIGAARRRGKWMGGYPVLGYDADPSQRRLVVNAAEAQQVREIFAWFVRSGSLLSALEEIDRRGWRLKSWTTRKGKQHEGGRFDRAALVRLLRNVLYLGEVKHHGKTYKGEQVPILDRRIWNQAQELLRNPKRDSQGRKQNQPGALLQGLLLCAGCGKPMVASCTTTRGRRYAYYVCRVAQQRGTRICPGKLVSRHRIEQAIVEALYQRASEPGGESLQQALPADRAAWEQLDPAEQHGILKQVVEEIRYDRGSEQGRLRWRAEVGGEPGEEVLMRAGRKALAQQVPPARVEKPAVESPDGRLPRITKLLALAVRFEELLRQGTAQDYADLARLGGVSRARITQLMNLRYLAPVIQEQILLGPEDHGERNSFPERALRRLTRTLDWREQVRMFEKLCPRLGSEGRKSPCLAAQVEPGISVYASGDQIRAPVRTGGLRRQHPRLAGVVAGRLG